MTILLKMFCEAIDKYLNREWIHTCAELLQQLFDYTYMHGLLICWLLIVRVNCVAIYMYIHVPEEKEDFQRRLVVLHL